MLSLAGVGCKQYEERVGRGRSVPEVNCPDAECQASRLRARGWYRRYLGGVRSEVRRLRALLDDASRMVPFAAFYLAENAACFQDALKQALLRRGLPRKIYLDNGATFRTHHLQVICATLNIALIHSRPYRPRGRGKIERFFRHVAPPSCPTSPPRCSSICRSSTACSGRGSKPSTTRHRTAAWAA